MPYYGTKNQAPVIGYLGSLRRYLFCISLYSPASWVTSGLMYLINPSPYNEHRIINFCLVFSATVIAIIQECFVNKLITHCNSSVSKIAFIFIQGEEEFQLLETY